MHTPVARTACTLRILLLTSALGRDQAFPPFLERVETRHHQGTPLERPVVSTSSGAPRAHKQSTASAQPSASPRLPEAQTHAQMTATDQIPRIQPGKPSSRHASRPHTSRIPPRQCGLPSANLSQLVPAPTQRATPTGLMSVRSAYHTSCRTSTGPPSASTHAEEPAKPPAPCTYPTSNTIPSVRGHLAPHHHHHQPSPTTQLTTHCSLPSQILPTMELPTAHNPINATTNSMIQSGKASATVNITNTDSNLAQANSAADQPHGQA